MRFLCNHGYYFSECNICSLIDEELEIEMDYWEDEFEFNQREEDYWLDFDEKSYRETQ